MKKQFISLALAVMMLLGVTGCAMSTPSSVGTIGGVDIPAGVYLLADLYKYAVDLAALVNGNVIGLVGGNRAAAADFGIYRARRNGLGRNLRQGAEQKRI